MTRLPNSAASHPCPGVIRQSSTATSAPTMRRPASSVACRRRLISSSVAPYRASASGCSLMSLITTTASIDDVRSELQAALRTSTWEMRYQIRHLSSQLTPDLIDELLQSLSEFSDYDRILLFETIADDLPTPCTVRALEASINWTENYS